MCDIHWYKLSLSMVFMRCMILCGDQAWFSLSLFKKNARKERIWTEKNYAIESETSKWREKDKKWERRMEWIQNIHLVWCKCWCCCFCCNRLARQKEKKFADRRLHRCRHAVISVFSHHLCLSLRCVYGEQSASN